MQTVPTTAEQLETMERELSELAYQWRGLQRESREIVDRYQTVLRQMIVLGFCQSLDADAELPDPLMPPEYFEMFNE